MKYTFKEPEHGDEIVEFVGDWIEDETGDLKYCHMGKDKEGNLYLNPVYDHPRESLYFNEELNSMKKLGNKIIFLQKGTPYECISLIRDQPEKLVGWAPKNMWLPVTEIRNFHVGSILGYKHPDKSFAIDSLSIKNVGEEYFYVAKSSDEYFGLPEYFGTTKEELEKDLPGYNKKDHWGGQLVWALDGQEMIKSDGRKVKAAGNGLRWCKGFSEVGVFK